MAVLHKTVIAVGTLADGQQQAEGHLRHTVRRIARHIGHSHAMAAAGLQVKVVGAGGDDAHPPELRALGQNGFVDAALVQEHDLCIPDARHHLLRRGASIAGDVRHQRFHARPVQISLLYGIVFQNNCFHLNFLPFYFTRDTVPAPCPAGSRGFPARHSPGPAGWQCAPGLPAAPRPAAGSVPDSPPAARSRGPDCPAGG